MFADPDDHLGVPGDIVVQPLADGDTVLLRTSTGTYFGLDSVGTAMWIALAQLGSRSAALRRLADEFDIDEDTLGSDLDRLTVQLVGHALLVPHPGRT